MLPTVKLALIEQIKMKSLIKMLIIFFVYVNLFHFETASFGGRKVHVNSTEISKINIHICVLYITFLCEYKQVVDVSFKVIEFTVLSLSTEYINFKSSNHNEFQSICYIFSGFICYCCWYILIHFFCTFTSSEFYRLILILKIFYRQGVH